MYDREFRVQEALRAAEMRIGPDPTHVQTVRERMVAMAQDASGRHPRTGRAWLIGLLMCAACGAGLASTKAGRNLVRSMFIPVQPRHDITVTTADGMTWTRSGKSEPYSPEKREAAAAGFGEIAELKAAGLGRLVGLLEGPEQTVYLVDYTLKDGTTSTVGSSELSEPQSVNMRIDEIRALRDAGKGEMLVHSSSPIGLGSYTIRFTLSDRTVDLQTSYPPGPREQREAIFAETRQLKGDLRFLVDRASVSVEHPEQGAVGVLRYTLADGRTVGIVEQIPAEALTPDGTHVVVPDAGMNDGMLRSPIWTAPDGAQYTTSGDVGPKTADEQEAVVAGFREVHAIKRSGGGALVGLLEGPGLFGEPSRTVFRVKYMLNSGETMTVGESELNSRQKANMRLEEIQRLRDTGGGTIVSHTEGPVGLGRYTIRLTCGDGEAVELQTWYPPGTRSEREAIFAETRRLKAQRDFIVKEARVSPGSAGVWGLLLYTLADGRSVGHYEQVPTDLIAPGGRHVVMPGTGEAVEIKGSPVD